MVQRRVLSKPYGKIDTESVERSSVLMWDTAKLTEQGFRYLSSIDPRLIRSDARPTSGSNLERNDFQPFPNLPLHFCFLILIAAAFESRADALCPKWRLEMTST